MILIEMCSGHNGVGLAIPVIFLVMVSAFLGIQVKAARIHISVELTEDALRQGTETILVREIVKVYPEAENSVASGTAAGAVADGADARRIERGPARSGRHRTEAHRGSHRAGLGASSPPPSRCADPAGPGAGRTAPDLIDDDDDDESTTTGHRR